ncbi:MAG: L-iditol 2-dehydrogenase, partial [Pseudomonadota bacterium]|nr:L-iditol 2-dehydrogenase [Pseudomonadota bacterium]
MKYDALVYNGSWNINIEQTDMPQIDDYGILVEIQATGICGTDMGIIMGKYSATPKVILGHESSGIVKQVGSKVSKFKENDRVYIDPTFYCGECFMCRTERPNHCELKTVTETGVSAHGTNTKFYVTTERFLYHLPEHVSFEGATLAEP